MGLSQLKNELTAARDEVLAAERELASAKRRREQAVENWAWREDVENTSPRWIAKQAGLTKPEVDRILHFAIPPKGVS